MIQRIKRRISNTSRLVKRLDYNAKITEIESEIPSISGLAENSALTAVENKIPDVSTLVKKTDYNTKISEIEKKLTGHDHDKILLLQNLISLHAEVFDARLARSNLITKTDFNTKLISLNKKLNKANQNIYSLKMNQKSCKHLF